jgi:hypothetical protein
MLQPSVLCADGCLFNPAVSTVWNLWAYKKSEIPWSRNLKYLFESGGSWVTWFVFFNFFMHKITDLDWQISFSFLHTFGLLSCGRSVKSENCVWFLLSYVKNKLFYVCSKNMKLLKFFIYKSILLNVLFLLLHAGSEEHWFVSGSIGRFRVDGDALLDSIMGSS